MSLPVCGFESRLGQDFQRNVIFLPSQYWDNLSMSCPCHCLCAVSNPAWGRIFREMSFFFPLNIGTIFRCRVLGQDTLLSHASLDSGVNGYLVGQRWQCVPLVPGAEMAASSVCSKKGVEMDEHVQ